MHNTGFAELRCTAGGFDKVACTVTWLPGEAKRESSNLLRNRIKVKVLVILNYNTDGGRMLWNVHLGSVHPQAAAEQAVLAATRTGEKCPVEALTQLR